MAQPLLLLIAVIGLLAVASDSDAYVDDDDRYPDDRQRLPRTMIGSRVVEDYRHEWQDFNYSEESFQGAQRYQDEWNNWEDAA